jgi:hypothetical protein
MHLASFITAGSPQCSLQRKFASGERACAPLKDQSAPARAELSGQFDRIFVAEDFHGLLELFGFERLL